MKTVFILIIFLAVPISGLAASTIYVPDDYGAIQDAIDAAVGGDTIIVRPGTYVENINFLGKAISLMSEQGANVTVIDGHQTGRVVTCQSGEGTDTVIEGFTITNGEGGMSNNSSSPTVTNCILWDNSPGQVWGDATVTFCCIQGGYPGTGNFDSDPLFVDKANGDFHLTFNSPCRASGDNYAVTEFTDFEGNPRIAYGTVDMGADEFYTHLYWTGDATLGGNIEVKLVGLPGTSPVFLWVGTGVLYSPILTMYGDWHLDFPILLTLGLGSIASPEGVSELPYAFDPGFPAMDIAIQSLIGMELTNHFVLSVR